MVPARVPFSKAFNYLPSMRGALPCTDHGGERSVEWFSVSEVSSRFREPFDT